MTVNDPSLEPTSMAGVIPGMHVQLTAESARIGVPRCGPADTPRINLIREGDVVTCIEVTCSCGKQTRLHCVY